MPSQYGFVIPNYNHDLVILDTIIALANFKLPIILVDDGSNEKTQRILEQIDAQFALVTLVRRTENGGKGAAVQTGLAHAYEAGWSHAIQVDADGQHDLNDVEQLIVRSKFQPNALVSGQPIYDESISKGRYYGRFITHFWVYIETLSFALKDTMCGFRIYPLAAYSQLISSTKLGYKMDFDIEVMVKLFWQGTPVEFIKTKVHYPENGVSHFNVWDDNVLISKMHTRLVCGMLWRLPRLIANKFK
ncbi:glycosyl transferase [Pseudoalteromonas porphyrae]|uniref:Glycosyltransferase family 2 protein n=1 Tax=Pseudoalteromonas neustonica TaxID=1840331 RepID=A0ABU9U6G2_9GAMM|nr:MULTISPECIES: glycosyltransferase family 2 protein [Pseudoalteromonas]KPH95944.1 glycosyl transferase [Pseudoalteromonas porphyrae]NMR25656.1 glycosyltransferase family 2 protein [Pseudoalteromonas sp. NEC-BIFX-2020_015]NNG41423.1 glycosyltransferase family 2 protein [Pseudoalteromonas sp. NEC-BIFX-2020_002]